MLEVNSGMIHKIGFDPTFPGVDRGYLVVQFANNMAAYGYYDVMYDDYLQLANAPSIGAAFNLLIKDKYRGELLTPKDGHIVNTKELSTSPKVKADSVPMFDVMEIKK